MFYKRSGFGVIGCGREFGVGPAAEFGGVFSGPEDDAEDACGEHGDGEPLSSREAERFVSDVCIGESESFTDDSHDGIADEEAAADDASLAWFSPDDEDDDE